VGGIDLSAFRDVTTRTVGHGYKVTDEFPALLLREEKEIYMNV
jgi:hypothetical protein